MYNLRRAFFFLVVIAALTANAQPPAAPPNQSASNAAEQFSREDLDFFEQKIRPVLVTYCVECHSDDAARAKRLKGGLRLDSRDGLLQGGDSGPAIVPGQAGDSLLLKALRYESLQMPPKGKLPANVIADFERWIARGAADPRKAGNLVPTSKKIDLGEGRKHWAYQPIRQPVVPVIDLATSNIKSPIDSFVAKELQSRGLAASPEADRVRLIRRAYFDLLGLPPSPVEIDEFVADKSPDAFERVVDRLMASPDFGIRWGRRWLGVARYAESVTLRGLVFPEAWRYRDYVIDSFNTDLPFDQFVIEQLAGDLLPAKSLADRQRMCVATAYLALGNLNLEEQDKPQLRMDVVDEQLEAIGKGFLGQTIGCARCHDHKFDPIPTRDYYALAGILASVQTLEDANVSKWLELPLPVEPESEAEIARLELMSRELQDQIAALDKLIRKPKEQAGGNEQKSTAPPSALSPANVESPSPLIDTNQARMKELRDSLKKVQAEQNKWPRYMSVKERTDSGNIPVHIRGSVHQLGDVVPRGFLQVAMTGMPQELPARQSGRKELGEWIASRDNPLTSRVLANRVWNWLFGAGLSRTVDNLGTTGEAPSHPELLDHLSRRLLDRKWSTKDLVRYVVQSHCYRQSSLATAAQSAADPENRGWSHQNRRRLDAECLLDSLLTASGRRVDSLGGSTIAAKTADDYGYVHRGNRRAVYWLVFRNSLPDLFDVFDFADPSLPSGTHPVSTVATQSLFFLNNPWVKSQAEGTAERLLSEPTASEADRVDRAFQLILGRRPSASESRIAGQSVAAGKSSRDAWTALVQALFASIDFRYVE